MDNGHGLGIGPDEAGDPWERFVGGPGDGIVYGPDGKPWRPGDPIPPRRDRQTGREPDPNNEGG
ncbi:hypothetical protein BL254_17305 [Protofrankia sp. BMG5.30]|uniref:Uncharacterized protein n=1 Tax=Protofrankia coriariae TaxID=1562887 RepID=A0ABR5F533_9ACTN|nr:hypothetical protein FrCorBMG51_08430 [Protofrankia coriariae]ONH34275.1 hypothetical protein BL254_17305 [Protofrankia sp. BMG5.30]